MQALPLLQQYRRWYDHNPKLAQAVRLLLLLPVEIQIILCEGVMIIANRQFAAEDALVTLKSMGSERVLGVHKSRRRLREYDQTPQTAKAMTYLYILSDPNRLVMADHILHLVGYIQDYLKACQEFRHPPTPEDVAILVHVYVEKGTAEVKQFLEQLRYNFMMRLQHGKENYIPVDFLESIDFQDVLLNLRVENRKNR